MVEVPSWLEYHAFLELLKRFNRIDNKILDFDWFCARLFVTRDLVGIRLQVSYLNNFKLDTCNWTPYFRET